MPEHDVTPNPTDDESAQAARAMVDGAEGTTKSSVRARLFEQALTIMSFNYDGGYSERGGNMIRGYSFYPGDLLKEPTISFLRRIDDSELERYRHGGYTRVTTAALHRGVLTADGSTKLEERPFTTDFYKVRRGKIDGYKDMSTQSVLTDMLKGAEPEDVEEIARTAVLRHQIPKAQAIPSFYRSVVVGFLKSGVEKFDTFLSVTSELGESDDADTKKAVEMVQRALNITARQLYEQPSERKQVEVMIEKLDNAGLIAPRLLSNIEMMANPTVAKILAREAANEDIFAGSEPHARRNNAWLLLLKILEQNTKDAKHNNKNAQVVRDALFKPGSYRNAVSVNDLLRLANVATEHSNQGKPHELQRALLPTGETGAVAFLNAGEAVFRVLSLTIKDKSQLEECRNYAELIDALLLPDYENLKSARRVTIADIAARYPDAKEDVVIEIQESAQKEGFAAASSRYELLTGRGKKRTKFNRHSPGYGIMS